MSMPRVAMTMTTNLLPDELWVLIERHTTLFRLVCAGVFVGGVGRLLSIIQVGIPGTSAVVFTAVELLFPLLAIWQADMAGSATAHGQGSNKP